jgi:hypothetical protein
MKFLVILKFSGMGIDQLFVVDAETDLLAKEKVRENNRFTVDAKHKMQVYSFDQLYDGFQL